MKFKKICLSTQLSDLYGRDNYQSHIELNREYWYYFSRDSEIVEGWYKIRITFIRSGCVFYVFSDLPNIPERYFPVSCFMASRLVFAEFDPIKDLPNLVTDEDKMRCCFDTEHTIVHNWNNEKEIEINEDDPMFLPISLLCKEIKD